MDPLFQEWLCDRSHLNRLEMKSHEITFEASVIKEAAGLGPFVLQTIMPDLLPLTLRQKLLRSYVLCLYAPRGSTLSFSVFQFSFLDSLHQIPKMPRPVPMALDSEIEEGSPTTAVVGLPSSTSLSNPKRLRRFASRDLHGVFDGVWVSGLSLPTNVTSWSLVEIGNPTKSRTCNADWIILESSQS